MKTTTAIALLFAATCLSLACVMVAPGAHDPSELGVDLPRDEGLDTLHGFAMADEDDQIRIASEILQGEPLDEYQRRQFAFDLALECFRLMREGVPRNRSARVLGERMRADLDG